MNWTLWKIVFAKSKNWDSPICPPQCSMVFCRPSNQDARLWVSRCCICRKFCRQKKFPLLRFPPLCFPPGGQTLQSCLQVLDVAFDLINSASSCLAPAIGSRFFAGKPLQSLAVGPKCFKASSHLKVVNIPGNERIRKPPLQASPDHHQLHPRKDNLYLIYSFDNIPVPTWHSSPEFDWEGHLSDDKVLPYPKIWKLQLSTTNHQRHW